MTEEEWLACSEPQKMLESLRGIASDRKLRLFACACCRSIWQLLNETRGRGAVEVSERHADGGVGARELATARRQARNAWAALNDSQPQAFDLSRDAGEAGGVLITAVDAAKSSTEKDSFVAAWSANVCAAHAVGQQAAILAAPATYDDPETYVREELAGRQKQYGHQSQFLRDLFGNPFRPGALDPAWQTPTVVSLAQASYDERALPSGELDPARLAVLSEALEEAGCTDTDILSHLRSPGPHVRGCWALDLILGRQ